jgi:polysaccharide pyruvyl transferase WcaK-like protein
MILWHIKTGYTGYHAIFNIKGMIMNVCILGWYGSETLGDRSILLGLLKILNDTFSECKIYLGSLNTYFTQRCLIEDSLFIKEIAPNVQIEVFDSMVKNRLEDVINYSDMICMGGGPIMDLNGLRMIRYAFNYARKSKKKTAIMGSGVGPLNKKTFRRIALDIFKLSDLLVLRDRISINTINNIATSFNTSINNEIYYTHDPAIIPVGYYLRNSEQEDNNKHIIVNLRDFPGKIFNKKNIDLDNEFAVFITEVSKYYNRVILTPNHNYFHGGDDRYYLAKIKYLSNSENVDVIHKPQNLKDLFSLIKNSGCCIGMRYHSILFHTLLNGRNAIIDYTMPENGKIISFLESFNVFSDFNEYYINMHHTDFNLMRFSEKIKTLAGKDIACHDEAIYDNTVADYKTLLIKLMS